jgi:SAM-dependent methyltransferase
MHLPAVNLVVMQPSGYLHSLGFLDQARYFRHQFRRLGATVTISKNRVREDSVNFVFGAHLGFDPESTRRSTCIFVNLEQLGAGGATVSEDYLALLRRSAVVDYDAANVEHYTEDPDDVPVVPFLYAPYLDDGAALPIEERPIDLLFFGSLNPRRQAFLKRVEASGVQVATFDQALYGAERDHFIRQSKAVLNCHFYETSRFEQARAFHSLSLGTPVISERTSRTLPSEAFESALFWLDDRSIESFFRDTFHGPGFADEARARIGGFATTDPIEAYADLLAFAVGYHKGVGSARSPAPWKPRQLNLGSGKDYRPGWLNVDILARSEPDLVLDLGRPLTLPAVLPACRGGEVRLEAGELDTVYANNVLEHVPDLPTLMTNLLTLLKVGGELEIEVPHEQSPTAWQDPTHLRALNEHSWLYYTDWFWYLGWFEHRFEIVRSEWLDLQLRPCERPEAAFMKVLLRKTFTTASERMTARTLQPDFGGIEDDLAVFEPAPMSDTVAHRTFGLIDVPGTPATAEPASVIGKGVQDPRQTSPVRQQAPSPAVEVARSVP